MIGVVTTSYPRHAGDFAGNFVEARVRALARAGDAVEVLAAGERTDEDLPKLDPRVTVSRIPFVIEGPRPLFYGAGAPEALESDSSGWLQALSFSALLAEAVRDRSRRWQRVESHWLCPSALVVAQIAPHLPHRAHAHSGDIALLERLPAGDSLARLLLRAGVTVVFASEPLRDRFARLVGGDWGDRVARLAVEPASSSLKDLAPPSPAARAALRARHGLHRPTVLAVGRLVPIKGYDLLIRAIARIPPGEQPTLVILGEGPERSRLEAMARARSLALRLPGSVAQTEVADWLCAADVFVHPSRRLSNGRTEGTPVAVLEALAAGLPVVATALGGLPGLAARSDALTLVPEINLGEVGRGGLDDLVHSIRGALAVTVT